MVKINQNLVKINQIWLKLAKTFLVFLNKMPEQVNENLYSSDISLDKEIIEILRDLN